MNPEEDVLFPVYLRLSMTFQLWLLIQQSTKCITLM